MQITSREEALNAPPTPKSQLRAFERRLYELQACTPSELLRFLAHENCKIMLAPEWGGLLMGLELFLFQQIDLTNTKLWGEQQECDFQFRKTSRRKSIKTTPFPQRLHGRVYFAEREIVIVTHTETDPAGPFSWIQHLAEEVTEYHVIRLGRK